MDKEKDEKIYPIPPDARAQMNMCAQLLDGVLNPRASGPPKVGFVLLAFNFGYSEMTNFISNVHDRPVCIEMLEHLIVRLKKQEEEKKVN